MKTATDMHMIGAFRHAIGIPDDMLPDAWRRTSVDEHEQFSETIEEACAPNPYKQEYQPRTTTHRLKSRVRGQTTKRNSRNEITS